MSAQRQKKQPNRWIPSRDEEVARTVTRLHAEWDEATFAGRLKLVRAHEGDISVRHAAQVCNLDNQSWTNWENGGTVRGYEEVCRKIVETFGCDGDWLLRGIESPCFNQTQLWPVAVKDAS